MCQSIHLRHSEAHKQESTEASHLIAAMYMQCKFALEDWKRGSPEIPIEEMDLSLHCAPRLGTISPLQT